MHIYKNFVECTVQSEFWMYIMQQQVIQCWALDKEV